MTVQGLEMTAPFLVLSSHPRLGTGRRELAQRFSNNPKQEQRREDCLLQQVGCLTNWTHNETKGTEEGDLAGLDLYLRHVGSQIFVQYLSRVSGQKNWQSMHK